MDNYDLSRKELTGLKSSQEARYAYLAIARQGNYKKTRVHRVFKLEIQHFRYEINLKWILKIIPTKTRKILHPFT